jgi:DNA-binding MarR family transcriptional regulator
MNASSSTALRKAGNEHRRESAVDALVSEWAGVVPGLDPGVRAVAARIARVHDRLRAATAHEWTRHGLTDNEFRLLAGLMRMGAPHRCAPWELAGRYVPVTSGGLTGLVNRLEKRALVARQPHPHDQRSFLLELTPAGRDLAQEIMEGFARVEARLMGGLSAADLDRGNAFLSKLLHSIEAAL